MELNEHQSKGISRIVRGGHHADIPAFVRKSFGAGSRLYEGYKVLGFRVIRVSCGE